MPYERRECTGKVLFIDGQKWLNLPKRKICVFEREDMQFDSDNRTRKLLELCGDENYILVDSKSHKILGLSENKNFDKDAVGLCFEGISAWHVFVGDEVVLRHHRGECFISRQEHVSNLKNVLQEVGFEGADLDQKVELFSVIMDALGKADHGALMVILEKEAAADEAKRLCDFKRGYKINPLSLKGNKKLITGMASVDGALLVDYEGKCHAFGVILDGVTTKEGREDRGSRYNSAKIYINQEKDKKRIAVIVSEDKDKSPVVLGGKAE